MMSRIFQTEVNGICLSEAETHNVDRGLNNFDVRKPKSIIVLLYMQKL